MCEELTGDADAAGPRTSLSSEVVDALCGGCSGEKAATGSLRSQDRSSLYHFLGSALLQLSQLQLATHNSDQSCQLLGICSFDKCLPSSCSD